MGLSHVDDPVHPLRVVSLYGIRLAIGRAPLWLASAAVTGLLALLVAAPWFSWFQSQTYQRYEPGSLLTSLNETFLHDSSVSRAALEEGTRAGGAVAAMIAMLFGAFAAGGWLQVFLERTERRTLRRFLQGGSRFFFRFVRVLGLTLLTLALFAFLFYGIPWTWLVGEVWLGVPDGDLEALASEATARRVTFFQDGLFLLAAMLTLVWGTYTRTRLASHDTRSAVWAGLCSWVLILRNPIRTLRPFLALFVAEAFVLGLAALFTGMIESRLGPESSWLSVALLVLIGQAAILWRAVVRGASYAASLQVTNALVPPLTRPDPWRKGTIGGPGGPQYPIGGDEYAVSM